MCGRFSVNKDLAPIVSELFNTPYSVDTNTNLSPSQSVGTIINNEGQYKQENALWGIKPNWSKKLIINAQSETVGHKPTFKHAFESQRCLVPCNGWFEWRTEEGKKVKYLFEHANKMPLYMAGILFKREHSELVTLTTQPNEECAKYHKRMPVLVLSTDKDYWFNSPAQELEPLLQPVENRVVRVKRAD